MRNEKYKKALVFDREVEDFEKKSASKIVFFFVLDRETGEEASVEFARKFEDVKGTPIRRYFWEMTVRLSDAETNYGDFGEPDETFAWIAAQKFSGWRKASELTGD